MWHLNDLLQPQILAATKPPSRVQRAARRHQILPSPFPSPPESGSRLHSSRRPPSPCYSSALRLQVPTSPPGADVRTSNPYRARAALPLLLWSAPPHRRLPPTPVLPPFSPAALLLLLCSARSLHVPPTPTVHTRRPPASSTPTLPLVGVSEVEFGGEPSLPDCWQSRSPGPIPECGRPATLIRLLQYPFSRCSFGISGMATRGLKIWAAAEDLASNRGYVLSLYRQLLRSLNSPSLPLNLAARLARKAEVRAIFLLGSEERSVHNIKDLTDTAEYALGMMKKGEIPKYIQ
ncbi:unnamed protein product [Linum trigynum]|uniref:LYR motif containing domain-containing protein n=1 Tax=Linum trigynum TaxID=586398 RepID=A0AAV2CNB9_9ROSI